MPLRGEGTGRNQVNLRGMCGGIVSRRGGIAPAPRGTWGEQRRVQRRGALVPAREGSAQRPAAARDPSVGPARAAQRGSPVAAAPGPAGHLPLGRFPAACPPTQGARQDPRGLGCGGRVGSP
eukprot:CAMPEP_0172640940 /NCGR_PEP_ID=MMETSP1068-20121228/225060_1 /TAXON_ID=35684 /ORGANISM="Pseudopedinella elastica, Strain CCMP716" /LENGTH=121 /DNA_ID=CAMNT_0013454409 /DNA_START=192 /DNA_END=553 /DNA_ORIENTATION=+